MPWAALGVKLRQAQLSYICRNAKFESNLFYEKTGEGGNVAEKYGYEFS